MESSARCYACEIKARRYLGRFWKSFWASDPGHDEVQIEAGASGHPHSPEHSRESTGSLLCHRASFETRLSLNLNKI